MDKNILSDENVELQNTSATVVFNTNEQKTATIGRVPRMSKMSSFYGAGDLNTSIQDKTNLQTRDKKMVKDSFRVPTVYRIGSLHLSEGVKAQKNDNFLHEISMS